MDLNKSKFALHDLSGASFLSDSMTLILRILILKWEVDSKWDWQVNWIGWNKGALVGKEIKDDSRET